MKFLISDFAKDEKESPGNCFPGPGLVREIRATSGQLQPWLVPHSVQTPQAPARITLLLPQLEQVVSMNMVPRAPWTRSAWVVVPAMWTGVP